MAKFTIQDNSITTLKPHEIFVFGSNLSGAHGKGAAKYALQKFGAIYGRGIGFVGGQSYGIPTVKQKINGYLSGKCNIDDICYYINKVFYFDVLANQQLNFLVTKVGCGLAGYSDAQIAPLFSNFLQFDNVEFPVEWEQFLGVH
jgi:hypothetical protein